MNGDVEELLREGLDRLTAQVQVPSGLAGRARAHHRRRKIAARAALACGTAAVTAVAVIAVASPGTRPGQLPVNPARRRSGRRAGSRLEQVRSARRRGERVLPLRP
jgi:hypothetical protein